MNDHDTIDQLRAGVAGHRSTRPVEEVLARGNALRARRRRPYAVGAAVLVGAAGITAATTFSQSTPAYASWTSSPEPSSPAVIHAIDTSCRQSLTPSNPITLAVLDRRGDHAVAVYTDDADRTTTYTCTRFEGNADPGEPGYWSQGGTANGGRAAPATPTAPFVLAGSGATDVVNAGQLTYITGFIAPEVVASVSVSLPGRTVVAAVDNGTFDAWWPAVDATDAAVTVTAYASDGQVLSTGTLTLPGFAIG